MASEFSFDIVANFPVHELKNAVDQAEKEIATRYDFRGSNTQLTLTDKDITIVSGSEMLVKSAMDVLIGKAIKRGLSPKNFEEGKIDPTANQQYKTVLKLLKILDQTMCKQITTFIKDSGIKVKASIQGDAVRVSSKVKDDLQATQIFLKSKEAELKLPITFTNQRD